jgi:beta-glucanase (GH16 family)
VQESYEGFDYTSARLRSFAKQDFLYGRIEARIKVPDTNGIWPAFWMLPSDWEYGGWPASGEIDVMESVNTATTIYGTLHFGAEGGHDSSGDTYSSGGTNFSNAFHIYRVDWEPTVMRWYVDGNLYHTVTSSSWWSGGGGGLAPFNKRFHILLNVAVGGDWPGNPDGSSVFPQQMVVDWVRVYRKLP